MGVATFYNRKDGKPFDEQDEVLMEVSSASGAGHAVCSPRPRTAPSGRRQRARSHRGQGWAGTLPPVGAGTALGHPWHLDGRAPRGDAVPPAVPHTVPGLVRAEHRHPRQDEQAGEPQGHRPGHGAVPRALRPGRDPAHPGTAPHPRGRTPRSRPVPEAHSPCQPRVGPSRVGPSQAVPLRRAGREAPLCCCEGSILQGVRGHHALSSLRQDAPHPGLPR